jgi:hypothetical protein
MNNGIANLSENREAFHRAQRMEALTQPPPSCGKAPPRFLRRDGAVLPGIQVLPIFWGSYWSIEGALAVTDVVKALGNIVRGPYLAKTRQYDDALRYDVSGHAGGVLDAVVVTKDVSWPNHTRTVSGDPPPQFTYSDVYELLLVLIGRGELPSEKLKADGAALFVFLPPGVIYENGDGADGSHNGDSFFCYRDNPGRRFPIAWVTCNFHHDLLAKATNDETKDSLTTIFSHELVEMVTDPFGEGVTGVEGVCGENDGWCEVGDICECSHMRLPSGELVQAYWSNDDNGCVVPTSF